MPWAAHLSPGLPSDTLELSHTLVLPHSFPTKRATASRRSRPEAGRCVAVGTEASAACWDLLKYVSVIPAWLVGQEEALVVVGGVGDRGCGVQPGPGRVARTPGSWILGPVQSPCSGQLAGGIDMEEPPEGGMKRREEKIRL